MEELTPPPWRQRMRGAWREGVVEGDDIVVGRGLALGWGEGDWTMSFSLWIG